MEILKKTIRRQANYFSTRATPRAGCRGIFLYTFVKFAAVTYLCVLLVVHVTVVPGIFYRLVDNARQTGKQNLAALNDVFSVRKCQIAPTEVATTLLSKFTKSLGAATMSSSLYSSFLLDVDGNFSPAKFFQSFCEIACSEQLQYPGISGHRFEYSDSTEGTCDAPEGHPVVPTGSTTSSVHTSSNLLGSFPAQSPLSRDSFSRSTFSPSPSSDPVGSASPVKEEQLEAISDDEDEDDNFNHSVKMELPPVSPPVSMPSDSNLPPSAPWAQSTPASMLSATSSPPASDEHVQHELPKRRVQHRLKLVLDLDNTLLHACARSKIGNCDIKLQHFLDCEGKPEMYKFVLPQILTQVYYVKLRPGLRRFLREVSEYCDLAIHTNATREYADVIVAILDPDRSLFRGR